MSIRIIWSTMIPKSNIWYGKIFSKSLLCKRLVVSFWRQCHGIFLALQCSTNVDFAWIQFLLVPQDQCLLMDAYPLDWESLWAFVPIVCASVGICITLDVVAVFIIYNRYTTGPSFENLSPTGLYSTTGVVIRLSVTFRWLWFSEFCSLDSQAAKPI